MAVEDHAFFHPIVNIALDGSYTSGDNTLVAAQGAGKIIRVVHMSFLVASAVTVRFESNANGTALTGEMEFAANGGIQNDWNPYGYFSTLANQLLNLELSSTVSLDGYMGYQVIETGVV